MTHPCHNFKGVWLNRRWNKDRHGWAIAYPLWGIITYSHCNLTSISKYLLGFLDFLFRSPYVLLFNSKMILPNVFSLMYSIFRLYYLIKISLNKHYIVLCIATILCFNLFTVMTLRAISHGAPSCPFNQQHQSFDIRHLAGITGEF